MTFADISLGEALVLEAYEEDILDEEETLLAFELLDKSKDLILHRNYTRFDLNQFDETECEEMLDSRRRVYLDLQKPSDCQRNSQAIRVQHVTVGLSLSLCRPNYLVWPCKTRDFHH